MKRLRTALMIAMACSLLGLARGDMLENFDGANGWLNSAPLSVAELRGKVVLVDFWEYTCVNCLRTLPYLREWYRRYRGDGFMIVGVHTPEFVFSSERNNVRDAVKRLDVTWPVALDGSMAIWNRYANNAWPHEFLFDQQGRLVEDIAGEGGYPQTEATIQALIKRENPRLSLPPVMQLLPQDSYDKPGAVCYPQTDEVIVGDSRIADAGPFNIASRDTQYTDPLWHQDGALYLQGYWHLTSEAAVSGDSDGYIGLKYHAIEVMAVMRNTRTASMRVNVTQDGKPIAHSDAGNDIRHDANGASYVTVDSPRAYQLLMNAHFGEHELRLMPQHYGLGLYSFAFESCEVPARAK